MATVLVLFLSLPLAIFDSDLARRPLWAGFCAIGLGFFLTVVVADIPIFKTTTGITNLMMKIPGADAIPPSSSSQVAPVSFGGENGRITPPQMQDIKSSTSIHEAVSGATPYMLAFVLASLGGMTVFFLAQQKKE